MQDLAVFPDRAVYILVITVAMGEMAEHTLQDILVHIKEVLAQAGMLVMVVTVIQTLMLLQLAVIHISEAALLVVVVG
jgi:hypothetical protein